MAGYQPFPTAKRRGPRRSLVNPDEFGSGPVTRHPERGLNRTGRRFCSNILWIAHAVNLPMQWESRRQSRFKIDLFSGDGVVEFQILGVQEISSIAGEAGEIFKRPAS